MASRMSAAVIDGVLVRWGDRLLYPRSRVDLTTQTPYLDSPPHRGKGDVANPKGDGQGNWGRAGHGSHRGPLPVHQQSQAAGAAYRRLCPGHCATRTSAAHNWIARRRRGDICEMLIGSD